MENWIDSIIGFLLVSSVILFVLGLVSLSVVYILKIRGTARLWICSILIMMPLVYPIQALFPDDIKISLPLERYSSYYFRSPDNQVLSAVARDDPDQAMINNVSNDQTTVNINQASNTEISDPNALDPTSKKTSSFSIDWKVMIISAWAVTFILLLIRFLFIVKNTRLLYKCADPVTDPQVLELLTQCAYETGLRHPPRILVIDYLPVPMAVGFVHPKIIIPKRLLEQEFHEGLRFTLLHELKHLHQHNTWWLTIESLVSAVYFFHPVIYWAKHRIHEEWEYICDSHVIKVTEKAASYADFLLHEIWDHGRDMEPALFLPFILSVPKTKKRVYSILEKRRPTMFTKIRDKLAVCIILFSFIALLMFTVSPSAQVHEEGLYYVNIEPTGVPGEYYVADFMDSIEKVKVKYFKGQEPIDGQDLSHELTDDQWSFDEDTRLLHVKTDVDNKKQLVIIYGKQTVPWTWKRKEPIQPNSVKILIGDRTAIRGEDFEVDEDQGLIRFLKPELCVDSTKYFISFMYKQPSSRPGISSESMGNHDDLAAIMKFMGMSEPENEDTGPYVPNSIGTNAMPFEPPCVFSLVQPVKEYGIKIALSKKGETGFSRWLTKTTDYIYDENTGLITLTQPIPDGYQQDYLFVNGLPRKDILFLRKDIKPDSVKIILNEGCDDEKRLNEGVGFTVDYTNQAVTVLDPFYKEDGVQVMVYWIDMKRGKISYGAGCRSFPEDYDFDVNYMQALTGVATPLRAPDVFAIPQILQEKGLYAYIASKDAPYREQNLKRDKDYSYDAGTGIITMLGDFDIGGTDSQLIVTGISVKRNEFDFHQPINEKTLEVSVENELLQPGVDYIVDYKTGTIIIKGEEILNPNSRFYIKFGNEFYGNQNPTE